ncbi:MAG: inositol monophosphatase family protein [Bdellovibrionales bacterium]|jgi:myo-inositol-1(or 4)-monophosphatase|nr:inositol monophosphatase family protein [Bdellovibrionales bacterium]
MEQRLKLGQRALTVAERAADLASEVLKKHYGRLARVDEKFQAGLVSEADRESEAVIKRVLLEAFPDHQILGEETGLSYSSEAAPSNALWMIDPLDGTTNYVHRVPFFCISIGLEVEGTLLMGLVDAPLLGARYHAIQGQGAFLNGQPIAVSKREMFRDGLFATGFSSADHTLDEQMELVAHVIRNARGIRRLGAAALDLCLVAEGIFDGFWEKNLQPWDTAAGVLIAREAGAIATDFEGRFFEPKMKSVLCASSYQHAGLLEIMKHVQGARLID